jgi:hypothetical protein
MRQSVGVNLLAFVCVSLLILNIVLRFEKAEKVPISSPPSTAVPPPMPPAPVIPNPEPAVPACRVNTSLPWIYFPLSATSRNIRERILSFEGLPSFKYSLPSIIASVEPALFRYSIGIGADIGDPWYDNTTLTALMVEEWTARWSARWPDFCAPELAFAVYPNTQSRNTWAVNYLAERAYHEGADYFYRINDDTVLKPNKWSSAFVAELASMRPIPGLGVTGPADPFQNNKLLTHSFVGRMHFLMYGTYFPFELGNWWTDPWIQELYALPHNASFGESTRMMTIRLDVPVEHKVLTSRYKIKSTQERYTRLLAIDREELSDFIVTWLKKTSS